MILVPLLCYAFSLGAQQVRTQYTINDNWKFLDDGIAYGQNESLIEDDSWEIVNIPHTWNARDPFDDTKSYKRGISWYRKHIIIPAASRNGKRVFLRFEGVNQVADVYVNNRFVGRHKGGYTAFTFDITKALSENKDQLIAVAVNNAHDPDIVPLAIGYALYGGIYRDVWLIITDNVHFDFSKFGSEGIKINIPRVSAESAVVSTECLIDNDGEEDKKVEVITQILDAKGSLIAEHQTTKTIVAGEKELTHQSIDVKKPALWSPEDPYLYSVKSILKIDDQVVDKIDNPLGFRWYSFNANDGFSLNGMPTKLRGTNRHQDFQGKGSALSNEDHRTDMEMIKNMGCNFLRLAHYPQDPEILKAADELGIMIWEEIPFINYVNGSVDFYNNAVNMLKEMIRQHKNHPSVIMWGSMNEIFLYGPDAKRIQLQEDTAYACLVENIATKLDSVIRVEDPDRYTTMAMHMSSDYDRYGIEDIPQIDGFNVYSGWYSGSLEDFGTSFDRRHKRKPGQIVMISEYGAGSDKRLNAKIPERFDFTSQYQIIYHESYLRQIRDRKFIAGAAIWNEFDFSQPHTGGSMPHLNQKGMVTWDRHQKDVYYLYKSNWNPEPMVYIAEKDWPVRASIEQNPTYPISAYSNSNNVQLYLNGKKIGSQKPNDIHKVEWNVKLSEGENLLDAKGTVNGTVVEDMATIEIRKTAPDDFSEMRINAGSNAQYLDARSNPWIEDTSFNGFYGYSGGSRTMIDRKNIIRAVEHTPMFYTSLENLNNYKLEVPNGIYQITLYFIEGENHEPGDRVFDVTINGVIAIDNLDLIKEGGFCYGVKKTFRIEVKKNELNIGFQPEKGKTTLSGLEVIKTE